MVADSEQNRPRSGSHRQLIALFDGIQSRPLPQGQKKRSRQSIADSLNLSSRSRVSELLRGVKGQLPVDESQLERLVEALGGHRTDVDEALLLYRAARVAKQAETRGWHLSSDVEASRHWDTCARGTALESEHGFRFRGRANALTTIVNWLTRPVPDRRILIVIGSPGTGKSAVLGRVVTTADAEHSARPPEDDGVVRASVGAVSCAVYAKGKSAQAVAEAVALAAGAPAPDRPCDLATQLQGVLPVGDQQRFNVVIDALEEAASADEARAILHDVVLPLVQHCSAMGVQVVLGTRRHDGVGDLISGVTRGAVVVDLDSDEFFEFEDLVEYSLATLRLDGSERSGNPYADDTEARLVARRIATLANRNFLVAGMMARMHGMYDDETATVESIDFAPGVDAAFDLYLRRLPGCGGLSARDVLTVLAFSEGSGMPMSLWHAGVCAIVGSVEEHELLKFARSAAADFLVESSEDDNGVLSYAIFHRALSEHLVGRGGSAAAVDEKALTEAFIARGRVTGWHDEYLRRFLPRHALRVGVLDTLFCEDEYVLNADLRVLRSLTHRATSSAARDRARLLQFTPQAIAASTGDRSSLFSVTEALEGLPRRFGTTKSGTYSARWTSGTHKLGFEAKSVHTDWVYGVCALTIEGRTLIASACADGLVRLWDAISGECVRTLDGHYGRVFAVCAVQLSDRVVLVSGCGDGTVRIWEPGTGEQLRVIEAHDRWVNAVRGVTGGDGVPLVASASDDKTVRLWNIENGTLVGVLEGHDGWIRGVCALTIDGEPLIASASQDRTVRLWHMRTGEEIRRFEGASDWYFGVCTLNVDDRWIIAAGSVDGDVWLWDARTGQHLRTLTGCFGWVFSVCAVPSGGETLLATASGDDVVRLWNPVTGDLVREMSGHRGWTYHVCCLEIDDDEYLASASGDGTVRLWNVRTGECAQTLGLGAWVRAMCEFWSGESNLMAYGCPDGRVRVVDSATGRQLRTIASGHGWVYAVRSLNDRGRRLLVTAGADNSVRTWDAATGEAVSTMSGHDRYIRDMTVLTVDGISCLVTASADRTAKLWEVRTGDCLRTFAGHEDWIYGVCGVELGDQVLLASAGGDGMLALWDPRTGEQRWRTRGHDGIINGVCGLTVDGRALLATAGADRTVRIWDAATGNELHTFEGHSGWVNAVCEVRAGTRSLLASVSDDGTVRLWDLSTLTCFAMIPVYHPAISCEMVAGGMAVGLTAGVLVLDLSGVGG